MKVCFKRTGSKAGSRDSPKSSHNTGIPIRMQFSSVLRKLASVSLINFSPFFASLFLTHRLAWNIQSNDSQNVTWFSIGWCKYNRTSNWMMLRNAHTLPLCFSPSDWPEILILVIQIMYHGFLLDDVNITGLLIGWCFASLFLTHQLAWNTHSSDSDNVPWFPTGWCKYNRTSNWMMLCLFVSHPPIGLKYSF